MKTYPKQKIGSRAYIGESMLKILICDDDPTFAQSMFKRILSLPAYSSKSMKLSCLTDIAEMSAVGYYRQCFRFCFQCYVYGDIRF